VFPPFGVVTVLAFGFVSGWIGWVRVTRPIYRRSLREPDLPPGVTRREFDRQLRSRAKRWRLVWTAVHLLVGVVVGAVVRSVMQRR
jgi:hypothetical protein